MRIQVVKNNIVSSLRIRCAGAKLLYSGSEERPASLLPFYKLKQT